MSNDNLKDSAAQSDTNAGTCQLLSLPAELRNRIYEYVTASSTHAKPRFFIEISGGRIRVVRGLPKLLQTCHQVRKEALAIWLESNIFTFLFYEATLERIRFGWFTEYIGDLKRIEIRPLIASSKHYSLEIRGDLNDYTLERNYPHPTVTLSKSKELLNGVVNAAREQGRR